MKIEEIPAGRKLDTLVAEKVMGWLNCDLVGRGIAPNPGSVMSGWHKVRRIPEFSTDIKAAWEVFRILPRELKHGLYCSRPHKYDPDQTVGVTWYFIDTHHFSGYHPESKRRFFCKAELDCGEIKWFSEGESLPHAICRAALKAVGITEVPD